MFWGNKQRITSIKLYSVGEEQSNIDRSALVKGLQGLFESEFGEKPKEYVIHGPYGISKGSSVGMKAFMSKLESKGHEKYYALAGDTKKRLGFNLSLESELGGITYSELIVWYHSSSFDTSFENIVKALQPYFPICSGFELETDDSYDTVTECKVKRGVFGGVSVEVSHGHLGWIRNLHSGGVRAIFKKNILSKKQLDSALAADDSLNYEKYENLYFVYSSA